MTNNEEYDINDFSAHPCRCEEPCIVVKQLEYIIKNLMEDKGRLNKELLSNRQKIENAQDSLNGHQPR
jgi:hypothetical protein